MSELLIKEKEVVTPGQVLATGMDYLPSHGTYRKDDAILANRLGLAIIDGKVIKTIPLSGSYYPKRNDVIVGKVVDILSAGWRVSLNCAYNGMIPVRDGTFEFIPRGADLTRYFNIGDYFVGKITNVTSQMLIDVSVKGPGLHKLRGGQIMIVNTNKVPRIIGKKGSMVSMIKQATDCKIIVGQNGLVWFTGDPKMEYLVRKTITKIENESHISGLTDRIKEFLEKETGKTISSSREPREEFNSNNYSNNGDGKNDNDNEDSEF